jgi:hypothetical protein
MLNQILQLLEGRENGLSLTEISREMKAQPSAVMSMINFLIQKGKIVEIGPDGKYCGVCGARSDCNLLKARGRRYVAAARLKADSFLPIENGLKVHSARD